MPTDSEYVERPWGWEFIDLAALGRNTWRSYAVTLACVIVLPVAFLASSFIAIYAAGARHLLTAAGISTAVLTAAFASVVVAGLCLVWRVERSHRRPWMSLVSADLRLDWRRLAVGAGVQAVLMVGLLALTQSVAHKTPHGGPAVTLPGAIFAILFTPFQAASEEMLFRGYLTQAFGRLFRNRWIIIACVGVLFGALHFDAYGALTLPYLFVLSAIFSLVSLRDERLELTIGAHTANNWVAVAAAYLLGASPTDVKLTPAALLLLILNGAVFYRATRWLVERLCPRR